MRFVSEIYSFSFDRFTASYFSSGASCVKARDTERIEICDRYSFAKWSSFIARVTTVRSSPPSQVTFPEFLLARGRPGGIGERIHLLHLPRCVIQLGARLSLNCPTRGGFAFSRSSRLASATGVQCRCPSTRADNDRRCKVPRVGTTATWRQAMFMKCRYHDTATSYAVYSRAASCQDRSRATRYVAAIYECILAPTNIIRVTPAASIHRRRFTTARSRDNVSCTRRRMAESPVRDVAKYPRA